MMRSDVIRCLEQIPQSGYSPSRDSILLLLPVSNENEEFDDEYNSPADRAWKAQPATEVIAA